MGCGCTSNSNQNRIYPQKIPSPSETPFDNTKKFLSDFEISYPNFNTEKIIKYYKNQKPSNNPSTEFIDPLFPPHINSILALDSNNNSTDPINTGARGDKKINVNPINIVWLRAKDIFEGGKFAVFENTISVDDIKQGNVGNCYFLAAISGMAENPQLIAQIFKTQTVQQNGCYEIIMRINGEWKIVILDDYFPCDINSKQPIFSKPVGAEIWVMLLEKAWAKINKGYKNIVAGFATEVMGVLTNFPKELIVHKNIAEEALWEKIKLGDQKGYVMACCSLFEKFVNDLGIVSGHAFTLVGYKEGLINKQKIRLLRIRNPWGNKEWNGDWSDNSKKWTEETKKVFDYTPGGDDGLFWIQWQDFLKCFIFTEFCAVSNPLCSKIFKFPKSEMYKNSVFEFYTNCKSTVKISVILKNYRFNRKIPENAYFPFKILLAENQGKSLKEIITLDTYYESPFLERELMEGYYTIVVIPHFNENTFDKDRKYVIDISSTNYFNLVHKGFVEEDKILKNLKNHEIKDPDLLELIKYSKNPVEDLSINNYDFIYKNIKVDFSKIYEKIDAYQSAVDFYILKYPKYMKELMKIVKVEDGTELIFKIYEWPTCFYIGDWKKNEAFKKHGRGIFVWDENTYTAGSFKDDKFHGVCREMNKGFFMEINYTNGQRDGVGNCTYEDGSIGKQEYKAGKFVKFI